MAGRRTAVGVALLAVAAVLAVAAAVVPSVGADTSTPTARAVGTPVTVGPIDAAPVAPSSGPSTTAAPAPAVSSATTLPLSPSASLVGPPLAASPPPVVALAAPAGLRIDAIGVDDPVTPVGIQADGQLEIPDEHHVGWYRLGAAPGQLGATVLAAHVNWHGVDGPFVALRQIEPGALVTVTLDDGSTHDYEVVERQQYDKTALPTERIWTHEGPETLVLITCGGAFNPHAHRYRHNIVAYALPIGGSS